MANIVYYEDIQLVDGVKGFFGTSEDLQIYHSSGSNIIDATVGDLIIKTSQNDGDIIFQSDNGSGGIDTYFILDGGQTRVEFSKATQHYDNVIANFGSSSDMQIYHNGTDSYLLNGTGNLEIINNTDDGDIIFKSDNGSGGNTPYLTLDGGAENISIAKNTVHPDSVYTYWGDANDFYIGHDSTNTNLINSTGHLYISK